MEVKTYRVRQYSSKPTTVVCVDGKPIVSVRGEKTLSNIISYLNGYDVEIGDKAVKRELDRVLKEETV